MPGTYISPAETGFYYLNSRYYDPETGRFINADSYVSTGQDILGYNMFAYCNNNPVNCIDLNGNSPWEKVKSFFKTVLSVFGKVKGVNDYVEKAKTVSEMISSFKKATQAKYIVANEVLKKAANPDHKIDTSYIEEKNKKTYEQRIIKAADTMNKLQGTSQTPMYDYCVENHITSIGELSVDKANELVNEIQLVSRDAALLVAQKYTKKFIKNGIDLMQEQIEWVEE